LGRLDILVNNAGTIRIRSVLEHDLESWDKVFAINTRAVFLCSQAAARIMADAGAGGRIIMISSHYAAEAHEGAMAYCASKAAVESIALNLALELAPYKITVNSIRVGSVPSTLLSEEESRLQRDRIWSKLQAEGVQRPTPPLGRRGTPEDIGAVVAFLASPAADWVTGTVIYADGGTHLRTMLT
jgi:NAD(P)-dependent dehydrogenase (short-subunit alcohol dehydrogenase family)